MSKSFVVFVFAIVVVAVFVAANEDEDTPAAITAVQVVNTFYRERLWATFGSALEMVKRLFIVDPNSTDASLIVVHVCKETMLAALLSTLSSDIVMTIGIAMFLSSLFGSAPPELYTPGIATMLRAALLPSLESLARAPPESRSFALLLALALQTVVVLWKPKVFTASVPFDIAFNVVVLVSRELMWHSLRASFVQLGALLSRGLNEFSHRPLQPLLSSSSVALPPDVSNDTQNSIDSEHKSTVQRQPDNGTKRSGVACLFTILACIGGLVLAIVVVLRCFIFPPPSSKQSETQSRSKSVQRADAYHVNVPSSSGGTLDADISGDWQPHERW